MPKTANRKPGPRIDGLRLVREGLVEEVFAERAERIEADLFMHPVLKRMMLDRTPVGTEEIAAMLGYGRGSVQNVVQMNRAQIHPKWGREAHDAHPRQLPEVDALAGRSYLREKGKVVEWMLWTGRGRFDPATRQIIPMRDPMRIGRPAA